MLPPVVVGRRRVCRHQARRLHVGGEGRTIRPVERVGVNGSQTRTVGHNLPLDVQAEHTGARVDEGEPLLVTRRPIDPRLSEDRIEIPVLDAVEHEVRSATGVTCRHPRPSW